MLSFPKSVSRSKILVVTERYWPEGSGGELATHLVMDMLRSKFEVTVITGTANPTRAPGVEYVYEPLLTKREKPILWLNTLRLIETDRFRRQLSESDIVYIPRFAFPIIPYAKKAGKKVVVHLHDYIPISYTAVILAPYEEHRHRIALDDIGMECAKGFRYCVGARALWWLTKLAKKMVSQADKVICVSKRQAEIIADQIPELESKIEVIYNPIPLHLLNLEHRKELDGTPTFLYVGGDSYVKGFYVLLQTLNMLDRIGIKANIIFANKYSSISLEILNKMKEKLKNVNLQIAGRIKYSELLRLHQKAQALIFPSMWEETFGYSVIEALFLNTIPICSKAGALCEILAETPATTYMFTPGDAKQLANKIVDFLAVSESSIKKIASMIRIRVTERLSSKSPEILIPQIMRG